MVYMVLILIYNTRDKTVINNYYNINSSMIHWINAELYHNLMIDFVNEDSIFFVYQLIDANPYNYASNGIEIFNFKIDGSLNYRYTFNDYQPNLRREINGVTATRDGGVIVDVSSTINYDISNSWLLRYSHNGNLDLLNIETKEKETINLYPNPAKNYVCVDIEATNFSKAEIELFDMQGKLVKRAKLSAMQGNRVDVSNLNAGAYTYNISLNGKTISGKVIIQ